MEQHNESLTEKMKALTPAQLQQVEGLVDSLTNGARRHAAASLSEAPFAAVWNRPENDAYDDL